MTADTPTGLAAALPSIPIILACLLGLALVVRAQARASRAAGVAYWQPWRVWFVSIAGGVFVLLQAAIIVSATGWIG